jgi:uncharacterized protein (DUF2141 family)
MPAAALALALALGASAAQAAACAPGAGSQVNVTVDGLRSGDGDLVVELYADNEDGFLTKRARIARVRERLDRADPSVCLAAPKPGYYALAVYHDENGDHKFNKNFLGLPTEGFGLSNNPPLRLGKPSFESVRFMVGSGETRVRVRLRYLMGGGGD